MIAMPDKRFNENQFLIPFTFSIFLILHSKESSDKNIIIIDDFTEPFRIHYNNFLTRFIDDLLLFDIFQRCPLNSCEFT